MNLFLYETAFCHGCHCTPLHHFSTTPVLCNSTLQPPPFTAWLVEVEYYHFCFCMHSTTRQLSTPFHILRWLVEGLKIHPHSFPLSMSTSSIFANGDTKHSSTPLSASHIHFLLSYLVEERISIHISIPYSCSLFLLTDKVKHAHPLLYQIFS